MIMPVQRRPRKAIPIKEEYEGRDQIPPRQEIYMLNKLCQSIRCHTRFRAYRALSKNKAYTSKE